MNGRVARRSGRGRWVLGAILMGLVGAPALAGPAFREEPRESPRARARNPTIDLGVLPVGGSFEARFAIENTGHALLRLDGAETSCSCALAEFDAVIPPGEVGHIRVTLETATLRGTVTKGISVRSNDPDQPTLLLSLKAHVVGSVRLLPQEQIYMRKRPGQPYVGRLLIRQETGERGTLAIGNVQTSSTALTVDVQRLDQPRPRGGGLPEGLPGDWVLEVRFRDDEPVFGAMGETVRFHTGLSRQPEVTVAIESNIQPPVNFSAPTIELVSEDRGTARGTLFAAVRPGLDPAELRAESDPPGIEVDLRPATGRIVRVEVFWAGGTLDDAFVRFRIGETAMRVPVEWDGP